MKECKHSLVPDWQPPQLAETADEQGGDQVPGRLGSIAHGACSERIHRKRNIEVERPHASRRACRRHMAVPVRAEAFHDGRRIGGNHE